MNGDLGASFRQKANYMKNWKPSSAPSSRDRLELYALHKQAISGDAPGTFSTQSNAERTKYNAWKSKAGMAKEEAMQAYIQESERQVRVYGVTAQTPQNTPALENNDTENGGSGQPQQQQPRGLAAIPLLCAAASESRQAYLRRLANTSAEQAWWKRQEPLCATPGTLWALPETILLAVAALVEYVSIAHLLPFPSAVVQSFLWPCHNVLLALWMGLILTYTGWSAASDLIQTIVWGSRRTGHSLPIIIKDQVVWSSQSVSILTENHQPLSARLVGLALLPYTLVVSLALLAPGDIWQSALYCGILFATWWYWSITLPWLALCLIGAAIFAGNCFALIEIAGV